MELDGRSVTADELARLALYNYGHFTTMRVDAGRCGVCRYTCAGWST